MKLLHPIQNLPPVFALLLGCTLFGVGSLIVAGLDIGSYHIAFWRLFIGFLCFLLLVYVKKICLPKSRLAICFALLSGCFLALDLALWHESIYAVGPGISTLLNSLQVFFLALFGVLYFNERLNKAQLLGMLVAFLGVVAIAAPEFSGNHHAAWGFISGILSALFFALAMIFVRRAEETKPMPVAMMMLLNGLGGALFLLPLCFWLEAQQAFLPQQTKAILGLLAYGLIMQCIAWSLIAKSIPRIALSLAGLLMLSEPVIALFFDAFFLQKPISNLGWLGAMLTLCGIYIATKNSPKAH